MLSDRVLVLHFSLIVWAFVTVRLLLIIVFITERGKLYIRGVDSFGEKTLAILRIPTLTTGLRSVSLQCVRRSLLSYFPQYWSVGCASVDHRRCLLVVVVTNIVIVLLAALCSLSDCSGVRRTHSCCD